jgi:hypothetical protein
MGDGEPNKPWENRPALFRADTSDVVESKSSDPAKVVKQGSLLQKSPYGVVGTTKCVHCHMWKQMVLPRRKDSLEAYILCSAYMTHRISAVEGVLRRDFIVLLVAQKQ